MAVRLSLALFLAIPALTRAADLDVSYLVQLSPLKKTTIAGTPLTFSLYNDSACTTQVASQVVNVENVSLIEQLKVLAPKNSPKPTATARLTTKMTGVTPPAQAYLKVTGTGVTAVGGNCQLQVSSKTSAPGGIWKDAKGVVIGPLSTAVLPASGGTPLGAALYSVPGSVIQLGILADGSGFEPDGASCLRVWFATTDCSGPGYMFPDNAPNWALISGTTAFYPTTTSVPSVSVQSFKGNCGSSSGCHPISFSLTSFVLAATADLSGFMPPFHMELQ